jgi:hypothetical protein
MSAALVYQNEPKLVLLDSCLSGEYILFNRELFYLANLPDTEPGWRKVLSLNPGTMGDRETMATNCMVEIVDIQLVVCRRHKG